MLTDLTNAVTPADPFSLPLAVRLALAYSAQADRPMMQGFFALDARMANLVVQAKEAMLAQLRLAWWREELSKPVERRAQGEPLLELLGSTWAGFEPALIAVIDGWEGMLEEPALCVETVAALIDARADGFSAIARIATLDQAADAGQMAGRAWAIGDLQVLLEKPLLKGVLDASPMTDAIPKLPRHLRPLAIMGKLGQRAVILEKAGLITGRRDYLTIIRLGMTGQ